MHRSRPKKSHVQVKQRRSEGKDDDVLGEVVRLRTDYRLAVRPLEENEDAGTCRVRIYEPLVEDDHHVVLIQEVPDNAGPSTTNAMEGILSSLFTVHRSVIDIETTLVFEYRPCAVQPGTPERLDKVTVTGWRIRHMPFTDTASPELGGIEVTEVEWTEFDRDSFEILVGSAL